MQLTDHYDMAGRTIEETIKFFDYPPEADKNREFRIKTIKADKETLYADRDKWTYLMFHTDNTLAWHTYLFDLKDIPFSIHSNGTIVIRHNKLKPTDPVSKGPDSEGPVSKLLEPLLSFVLNFKKIKGQVEKMNENVVSELSKMMGSLGVKE